MYIYISNLLVLVLAYFAHKMRVLDMLLDFDMLLDVSCPKFYFTELKKNRELFIIFLFLSFIKIIFIYE